jgi:hypothetical protein
MTKRQQIERARIARYTRNILRVYRDAPRRLRTDGARWYAVESDKLATLADELGKPLASVAGAAAAISPGMRWDLVEYYVRELAGPSPDDVSVPTYSRANVDKAIKCLLGADPLDTLGGDKVRAFFTLLWLRGATDDVVIDGHAYNIARAERTALRGDNIPAAARVTKARYRWAAAAYRRAAEILGIAPHAVQAVTWLHWRERYGVA